MHQSHLDLVPLQLLHDLANYVAEMLDVPDPGLANHPALVVFVALPFALHHSEASELKDKRLFTEIRLALRETHQDLIVAIQHREGVESFQQLPLAQLLLLGLLLHSWLVARLILRSLPSLQVFVHHLRVLARKDIGLLVLVVKLKQQKLALSHALLEVPAQQVVLPVDTLVQVAKFQEPEEEGIIQLEGGIVLLQKVRVLA